MVARSYIPNAGDVVWLDFSPPVGHEQAGRRPAVVVSPKIYNEKAGLAVFCPVTGHVKNYPFEAELPRRMRVRGVILADQLKSLDWRQRRTEKCGRIPAATLEELRKRIAALVGLA